MYGHNKSPVHPSIHTQATLNQSVKRLIDGARRLPQTLGEWKSKSGTDVDRLMPTLLAMRDRVQTVTTEYYVK